MESQSTSEVRSGIFLEEMQVEFEIDGGKVSAPAKAFLYLRPQPSVVFEVRDVPNAIWRGLPKRLQVNLQPQGQQ